MGPNFKGHAIGPLAPWRWDRKVFPKRQLLTTNLRFETS